MLPLLQTETNTSVYRHVKLISKTKTKTSYQINYETETKERKEHNVKSE